MSEDDITLDNTGCVPDIHTDEYTSTQLRRIPGSSPEERSKASYNLNGQPIVKYMEMISACWPTVSKVAQKAFPEFAELYNNIIAKAVPNFLGAKAPVKSGLQIQKWRDCLTDYHDSFLCDFLEFGWPLGYKAEGPPESVATNHPSAKAHMPHVTKFIQEELNHDALLGPFEEPPFKPWVRISPLMTRSKKDSLDRRIIVDLSFPPGLSVNDGIDPKDHFGNDITYSLPSIMDLVTHVKTQGKSCYLWKADLTRAYRQLRVDPADSPLLGIKVGPHIYIDCCPLAVGHQLQYAKGWQTVWCILWQRNTTT